MINACVYEDGLVMIAVVQSRGHDSLCVWRFTSLDIIYDDLTRLTGECLRDFSKFMIDLPEDDISDAPG